MITVSHQKYLNLLYAMGWRSNITHPGHFLYLNQITLRTDHPAFTIEFNTQEQETIFRIKYSEYL